MPTEPRYVPVNPSPDAARRRLHIHGIKEMPSGYDAEVAELFRDLRSASNLTETDLAARLGTRIEVVQALEQGALYALPPWAETCRIVNGYGALLSLDVRPLLRRIYAQLEAGIVELKPRAVPDLPTMDPPDAEFTVDEPSPQPAPPPFQNAGNAQAPWPNGSGARNNAHQPQWPTAAPPAPNGPLQNGPAWNSAPHPSPQQTPAWQAPQSHAQPQAWPGGQTASHPQDAWQPGGPAAPQQNRAPSAPPPDYGQMRPDTRTPAQSYPPSELEPQAARQPAYQPSPPAPPRAAAPMPVPVPEVEKKKGRSPLLKWGLGALVISIVAFGLWMALGNSGGSLKATNPTGSGQVLDPDDPRSRKADRLPSPY